MAQTSCGDEKQLLIYEKGKQRHRAPCWIGLLGSRLGAPEAFPAPAPREGSGPALPSPAQGAAPSPCPTAPCWRSAPEGPRVMVAGVTRRTGICRGWHQRRMGGFPAVGSGRSSSPCQAHSRMLGRATSGISKHPALDVFWDSQQSQLWGHPAVRSPSCGVTQLHPAVLLQQGRLHPWHPSTGEAPAWLFVPAKSPGREAAGSSTAEPGCDLCRARPSSSRESHSPCTGTSQRLRCLGQHRDGGCRLGQGGPWRPLTLLQAQDVSARDGQNWHP